MERQRSQTPYADNNAIRYAEQNTNAYAAAQQQVALQRLQQNAGGSRLPGRPDSFVSPEGQRNMPPKAEETWDQKLAGAATPMSAHPYIEDKMERKTPQTPYADNNANCYAGNNANPYAAAQLQQIASQRLQQNAGVSRIPGRPESFVSAEQQINMPPKGEETWDQKPARGATQMSAQPYREAGQVNYAPQSLYDGPKPVSKGDVAKYGNNETRLQSHEQDMEIGYEDKPSAPTLEGLERRFIHEIMQLAKEQCEAEDAENARHRQKLVEINSQHQEKLTSLRAHQAKRREEFLLTEAQTRLHQYQEGGLNLSPVSPRPVHVRAAAPEAHPAHRVYSSAAYGRAAVPEAHQGLEAHRVYSSAAYGRAVAPEAHQALEAHQVYSSAPYGGAATPEAHQGLEAHRVYSSAAYGGGGAAPEAHPHQALEAHQVYHSSAAEALEAHRRDRTPTTVGVGRNQGTTEERVPVPKGRVYNNTTTSSQYYR